jgi:hypothetical protein
MQSSWRKYLGKRPKVRHCDIVGPNAWRTASARFKRSCENTNVLLRQYYPKCTDFAELSR